jgi:hypothetical protein
MEERILAFIECLLRWFDRLEGDASPSTDKGSLSPQTEAIERETSLLGRDRRRKARLSACKRMA